MKTKQYIIKITATDKEHAQAKKRIESLFKELNRVLAADMETYIQSVENPKYLSNLLYGLESRNNLTISRLK